METAIVNETYGEYLTFQFYWEVEDMDPVMVDFINAELAFTKIDPKMSKRSQYVRKMQAVRRGVLGAVDYFEKVSGEEGPTAEEFQELMERARDLIE